MRLSKPVIDDRPVAILETLLLGMELQRFNWNETEKTISLVGFELIVHTCRDRHLPSSSKVSLYACSTPYVIYILRVISVMHVDQIVQWVSDHLKASMKWNHSPHLRCKVVVR